MKEKKEKKPKNNSKKNIGTEFINVIKKRWLISGTNTLLLIAILIAIVILINSIVRSLELTPIDCTSNKEHTLTDQSKEKISNIEQSINIYFVGYDKNDAAVTLAKQYNKTKENINVEVIDINERTDIADKYNLVNGYNAIVVENGERSKTLLSNDLYTYDNDYKTIDLTEEKITSAILNVTSDKVSKVYFLTGYSDYSIENAGGLSYLSAYLEDEVLEYEALNILVSGSVPEDCDTLVITTPNKDFDELTSNEIINYINKGGNILWLNSSYAEKLELPNVNKILALYGVKPFEVGYIYETDNKKITLGYSSCIVQDLGNTNIAANLTNAILLNSTKINVNEEELENLKVEQNTIITSADTSYFRKNISNTSTSTDGDEQGEFTIGSIFTKTLSENTAKEDSNEDSEENNEEDKEKEENKLTSKLVLFGDNNFISDIQLTSQVSPMLFLANNKDVILNSIAYLTDRDEGITIRKNYNQVSDFTATEGQKAVIIRIIFAVPIGIILLGIIVWQIRRRKK